MEAIVLAGGLGTRLRGVVDAVPKCMAPVANRPFLQYLLTYLASNGITSVIFSLGYKHEIVEEWVMGQQWPFSIRFTVEDQPLGTGGAIKAALQEATEKDVFIVNGDTFFDVDLKALYTFHLSKRADISIALKPMVAFDRYGTIILDETDSIRLFREKMACERGLINGGIYLVNRNTALFDPFDGAFSFETDVLQPTIEHARLYGYVSEGYFIDIGIPDDYRKANEDATLNKLTHRQLGSEEAKMALFIDRDGVINRHLPDDYVKNWDEFEFLPGVLEAFQLLSTLDAYIFVVTNQRGVGKGIMLAEDLSSIHEKMLEAISNAGGRIDRIYTCTDTDPESLNRKPNPGMALQAKNDFPTVDFLKSIMVGDSESDVEFGRRLGMRTIWVGDNGAEKEGNMDSLLDVARKLSQEANKNLKQ